MWPPNPRLNAKPGDHMSRKSKSDKKLDDHLWLNELHSPESLAFVEEENKKTLGELTSKPIYQSLLTDAHQILSARDKIPLGDLDGDFVYNFWQDDRNERGLWRRTYRALPSGNASLANPFRSRRIG
ncbi:MAG: S9 family peptidase [Proteobacteria bacterium]|nr:MAG: S9 family peptidase [Pseudomonadota bacterium]